MSYCNVCQKNIGIFSFTTYDEAVQRCGKCNKDLIAKFHRFSDAFVYFVADNVLSKEEFAQLKKGAEIDGLKLELGLAYIRSRSVPLLEHSADFFIKGADPALLPYQEKYLNFFIESLAIPQETANNVRRRVNELKQLLKQIESVKQGHLPTVRTTLYLDSDEVCHLQTDATYYKNIFLQPDIHGTLVVTNKRLLMIGAGGFEFPLKRVILSYRHEDFVCSDLSTNNSGGGYKVAEPLWVEAVIDGAVRASKEVATPHSKTGKERPAPSRPKSPHQILSVDSGATAQQITEAYRRMAKLYHPDKVASLAPEFQEIAETRMKEINAAYQQLLRSA